MNDWTKKRTIDSTKMYASTFKTLRKFINVKNDDEVLEFALASGVRVGRGKDNQYVKSYLYVIDLYNAKIEYEKDLVEQRKEQEKLKLKRIKEQEQKKAKEEEKMIIKTIKEFNKTGKPQQIDLDNIKHLKGGKVLDLINKHTTLDGKNVIQIDNKFFKASTIKKHIVDALPFVGSAPPMSGRRSEVSDAVEELAEIEHAKRIGLINFKGNTYKRATGAFFPYTNNTIIDLSDYGIYQSVNPSNYKNNCLIHALLMSGVTNLDNVRRVVKCDDVPKSKLGVIADLIQRQIHVKQDGYNSISKYGKDYPEIIKLGLIENHFFLIDEYPICHYAVEHYKEVKDLPNFQHIKTKEGKYYKRDVNRTMNSFDLIKKFQELGYFTKMTNKQVANCQYHDRIEETFDDLSYNEALLEPIEPKESKDKKPLPLIVFDFETNTEGTHTPYLCCSYDGNELKSFIGADCAKKFLDSLPQKCIILAHNASYDRCFIVPHLINITEIARGSHLLSMTGTYFGKEITIKDSYNLITMPLRSFGKTFNLDCEKEIMPYTAYIKENIMKRFIPVDELIKHTGKDTEQFLENIKKWDCLDGDKVDIIKYSKIYCEIDCIVLYKGYFKFRDWALELDLDINDILTSASLAHQYFVNTGCYDGVYELTSTPQSFIQSCVVGGRCMIANNKKYRCDEIVNDFDAVSLYPSAMKRMGFLKGKPKVITDWKDHDKWDGYFIEIEIKRVGKHRAFPLMSYVNEKGVRTNENEMVGKRLRVDKTMLEDMINFQKVEYEFIKGYYFNDGLNYTIQETITTLFNTRKKLKSEGNPAQEVYKLIMNSGYGKSIMKPIETSTHFFNTFDDFEKYWAINHAHIKDGECFENIYKIKKIKPICEHHNIAHVGASILSMSKRIMNEVMCCAEDEGIQLMYQDTDSIHLRDSEISKLAKAFENKYGRELIGKDLGQFHSDFDIKGCKDVVATNSIFLGKKCYIDKLLGDGEKVDYHIRLKGVPNQVILNYCDEQKITPFELYEQMYKGKEIVFDLTKGSCCFQYTSTYNVFTQTLFQRKIKF